MRPPAWMAARWAMASTPRARPLTTQMRLAGELVGDLFGHLTAVGRGAAGADDGDGPLIDRGEVAADVEDGRRVVDLLEEGGVGVVVPGEGARFVLLEALEFGVGVYGGALSRDGADDAVFEAGGTEVSGAGEPGVGERAEAAEQCLVADAADAVDTVEGRPVLELVGRGCGFGFRFGCH